MYHSTYFPFHIITAATSLTLCYLMISEFVEIFQRKIVMLTCCSFSLSYSLSVYNIELINNKNK